MRFATETSLGRPHQLCRVDAIGLEAVNDTAPDIFARGHQALRSSFLDRNRQNLGATNLKIARKIIFGFFEIPNWDEASLKRMKAALLQLGDTVSDTRRMFGADEHQVDPVKHLIGSAMLWGGNPEKDALYLPITPIRNDGSTIYKLTVRDIPVDGFWSVTVYNGEGYLHPNTDNAYAVNGITAKKAPDGSVTIQFGGCDGKIPNCLPITEGWNYTVRLFQPRPEILDGAWRFPEAQPVS